MQVQTLRDTATDEPQRESNEGAQWLPPLVHAFTMFTVMRAVEAYLWPDPFADVSAESWGYHYKEAFTKPPLFDKDKPAFPWDGDRWEINVIGHGLMGSELYLRSRQCHFGWGGALAFTAGSSLVWEYGFEANGVRPSAQDMVLTPVFGLLLGESRYFLWKSAGKINSPTTRTILRAVVDPFGELERGTGLFDC